MTAACPKHPTERRENCPQCEFERHLETAVRAAERWADTTAYWRKSL